MNTETRTLHFGDLLQIAFDAGLAETDDATEWLAARGICEPAIDQYARGIVDAATESGHDEKTRVEGVFTSGLTLGIAIGESLAAGGPTQREEKP